MDFGSSIFFWDEIFIEMKFRYPITKIFNLNKIIGKKISRDMEEGDYIRKSDFILKWLNYHL